MLRNAARTQVVFYCFSECVCVGAEAEVAAHIHLNLLRCEWCGGFPGCGGSQLDGRTNWIWVVQTGDEKVGGNDS